MEGNEYKLSSRRSWVLKAVAAIAAIVGAGCLVLFERREDVDLNSGRLRFQAAIGGIVFYDAIEDSTFSKSMSDMSTESISPVWGHVETVGVLGAQGRYGFALNELARFAYLCEGLNIDPDKRRPLGRKLLELMRQEPFPEMAILIDDLRDSPDNGLKSLELEWNAIARNSQLVKKASGSRDKRDAQFDEFQLLLEKRCRDAKAKLKIIEWVSSDDPGEFAATVRAALLFALLRNGDRTGLVDMFSRRGYRYLSQDGIIELGLASSSKVPDPFLILCDAFDASVNPSAKKELADALRRALEPLGVNAADDRQMATESRRWYMEHKAQYVVNSSYEGWEPLMMRDGKLLNTAQALFITKEEAKKRGE